MIRQDLNISTGKVLLASPFMDDPNFTRAAVLICSHNDQGTIGFVFNKPMISTINDAIYDFSLQPINSDHKYNIKAKSVHTCTFFIAFKKIQRLRQHDGCHLRQNPEADTKQAPGAGGGYALCLALFGVFDGFRIQLRQDPDIRYENREHPCEGT